MTRAARGLLDTSVFIAAESGRPLAVDGLPATGVLSAVTIAELAVGVMAASDVDVRARRMATVDAVTDIEVLPIDAAAAVEWARLRVHLAEAGRRANVNDLWIAATAAAHGLPVYTQDADFDVLDGLGGLVVVRV